MRLAIALFVLAIAPVALADGIALGVHVGKTVERNVGVATGWFCDDPSLIEASLVTRGEVNIWIVRGVKPGTTQCRVGTDAARASYLFEVTVKPARR